MVKQMQGGDEGTGGSDYKDVENKYDFSCRRKDAMSSAFWSVPGNLFQKVGAGLRNDLAPECILFGFSPNPEVASLHCEEERRERGVLYAETSFCRYRGVVSCTRWYVRERTLYSTRLAIIRSVWRRATKAETVRLG